MSDFVGFDGASGLSEQLALYRTLDARKLARDSDVSAANDVAWRNQFNDLVSRYNRLLADANKFARLSDETIETQVRTIADISAANDALRAERKQRNCSPPTPQTA